MAYYDDSVERRVAAITSQNSPLMKSMKTQGLQFANKRGLMNSSMAAGAAQQAAINAALPMAQQEADQAFRWRQQGFDIKNQNQMLDKELTSRERLQGMDISSREKMQGLDITSREKMQGLDIASREKLAGQDNDRFAQDLEFRQQQLASNEALSREELASRQQMQQSDIASREQMAQADRENRLQLTGMELGSRDQQNLSAMLNNSESSYSQIVSNIMNNTNLNADVRNQLLEDARNWFVSQQNLAQQLYGINLNWSSNSGGGQQAANTASGNQGSGLIGGSVQNSQSPGIGGPSNDGNYSINSEVLGELKIYQDDKGGFYRFERGPRWGSRRVPVSRDEVQRMVNEYYGAA